MSAEKFIFHPRAEPGPIWDKAMLAVQRLRALGREALVTIRPNTMTRTEQQNLMIHGICRQLERSRKLFSGKPRKTEEWKRILASSWAEMKGLPVEVVPSISGKSMVHLGVQTSSMNVEEMSELISYAEAYAYGGDV